MRSAIAGAALLVASACADRAEPTAPTIDASITTTPSDTSAPTPTTEVSTNPVPSGYPWSRLGKTRTLHEPAPPPEVAKLGAKSIRTLGSTDGVQMIFVVLEFASQKDLLAAREKVPKIYEHPDARPYYVDTAYTGSWLLIVGFPGDKPVSPEMDAAKKQLLQQWWGEE